MGLSQWREYTASTEPWKSDPKKMRLYFTAALSADEQGDDATAARFLGKGIAAEAIAKHKEGDT